MLSSAETHLREAVAAAQADGLGREVFVNMATTLYDNAAPTPEGGGSPTPDAAEAIYDELPDELIDLAQRVPEVRGEPEHGQWLGAAWGNSADG